MLVDDWNTHGRRKEWHAGMETVTDEMKTHKSDNLPKCVRGL